MKGGQCAPGIGGGGYQNTCFTLKALKEIASQINKDKRYQHTPNIDIKKYNKKNKDKLVNDIQKKLSCNGELDFCILNKKTDFYKQIKTFFKPKNPGSKKWLSTIDIADVMKQYMRIHPDFIFFGPVPLDFDLVYNELANINLKKLSKQKSKIGIVFNLDYSYQPGSHWVSMFIDLKNKTICYFDSVGDGLPKEISKLTKKLIKQGKSMGVELKLIVNKEKHQFKNTECGVYSLYFIVSRLEGKSCDFLFKNIIKDDKMLEKRKKFFRD